MGKVVEKKRKKKGRPSLIDLQKRNLRQQQQQQQHQPQKRNSNPYLNPNFRNPIVPNPNPNPNRRFTRRNPNPDAISGASDGIDGGDEDDDEEDDDSSGKRREKKLRLVLRLPSHRQQQRSSVKSSSLNSGSDSNAEDENGEIPHKKRKINSVADGSGHGNSEKAEKPNSGSKATYDLSGTQVDSGPTTLLPDKQLLVFILDRLQKKDTYGVFSEPVDPKELPDYHEVIADPMDFATVRKKLAGGTYANLEQFETDVFLICSNAMRYNSPDTIYFRQARSIQELAKKDFENLRQDSDDNEPQPKVVRRGRPPTKNLKGQLGRPPFERAGSEFSDATLATGGDNAIWSNSYNLRKGPVSDKSGPGDSSGRIFHGPRSGEAYINWSAEQKAERNDEFPGSMLKGTPMKNGKKLFVLDENRRNTYKKYHPSVGGREPSVLTTFDGEKKQLMAVGLQSEHGYARSLARFAANLGPIAWKVASKKIETVLPVGFKFGPGWVGENTVTTPPQPLPPSSSLPGQLSQCQPLSIPKISSASAMLRAVESKGDKLLEMQDTSNDSASDSHRSRPLIPFNAVSSSSMVANISPESITEGVEAVRGLNSQSGLSSLENGSRPSFQVHQGPVVQHSAMNGFAAEFGFNVSSQMGKLIRPARPIGNSGREASMPSLMQEAVYRSSTKFAHPMLPSRSDSVETKLPESSSAIEAGGSYLNSGCERQAAPVPGPSILVQPSWRGVSLHQNPGSIPPDLNIRFQSPGSPSSSMQQPDLALQL